MTPAGEHGLQTTKTMTADAHLLYNDKHRHKARRNIVKVNQGGITTIPVVGSKSFTITVSGGNMFHVQLAASSSARTSPAAKRRKKSNYLLGVSMATLMGRSDTILRKAEVKAKLSSASNLPSTGDSSLWVDKHAPTAFCHLLSDEQTNRQVLRALRAWDPYVFRQAAQKVPSYYWENMETKDVESADVRPNVTSRVLLLSGPPGVGKTTLAHIVARHAGYHPVEVNASDDRSASTLMETVVRAMESSTLNFGNSEDSKPNCLILDEVDGADAKSAVASLVEIIRADIPQKGGKQKTYLRRPIIFICNHKYAPTLRPLLPYAVHFDVDPPSDARLVGRLRAILAKEQLSLDGGSSLLQHLIGGTGGDIRSCLYTLQFSAAKARQSSKVQAVDISSALKSSLQGGDGLKDARNDLVSTVTTVFKKNKKKEISDATAHMVLEAVDSFGEHSKTLECLFGNLMQIPYVDPTMERCLLAHEWLSGADRLGGSMQSLAAGAIHVLCRVETRPDLSFSTRQGSNVAYALEANRGIVQKFIEGLSPSFKTSHRLVTIETVPYALWMLSAGLGSSSLTRPVSSLDILDKPERAAFGAHVSTLRSLGLTYVAAERRDKSGVALVDMKLEPEIDRLVCFGGYIASPENRRRRIPSVVSWNAEQHVEAVYYANLSKAKL
jgi:chromosome transmission fidelity protein 18